MKITNSSHAMNDLAEMLYRYAGRVVLDRTGLSGVYSISLTFTSGRFPIRQFQTPTQPLRSTAVSPSSQR